ncbi:MAG TPA: hypothetical protein VNN72_19200, partial [Polyangiaceae bacterium]|nr:hypothetical protein [Polyangiaceae bacterium]
MLASLALGAGVVLAPRAARAGDATEPIRIEYRAEPGCPTAEEFNAQVFRRTSSARLATGGDTARTFIVGIERRGTTLTGSLVIRQADGTSESREVRGPDCSEVATVLALATALAIDPKASLSADAAPLPMPDIEATSEPPPPPLKPPESKPLTPSDSVPPPDEDDDTPAPWIISVGPAVEAAVAPRVAFGGALGVAYRPPGGGAISAVGFELNYLATGTHHVGTAASTFDFIYARPALCSVALRWQEDSGVAPCLASELGAVTG